MIRQNKKGFTIIEVTLALAVTAAMLVAFMATISSRITRERYSDATKGFADALRMVYSEVENVENGRTGSISEQNKYCTLAGQAAALTDPNATANSGSESDAGYGYVGRSGCAIYGKLISFGDDANKDSAYHVYDVIGRAVEFRGSIIGDNVISNLKSVYADIMSFVPDGTLGAYSLKPAGAEYAYYPTWEAWLETPDGEEFKGEILIVRSPVSGAVHTYILEKELDFQYFMNKFQNRDAGSLTEVINNANSEGYEMSAYLENGTDPQTSFVSTDLDLCVASNDFLIGLSTKNNIRIKADGHDSSAIEIVETDSEDNRCKQ
ncbi:hypothetical protein IJI69_04750 [Candidatus Saccharibacteria bacterium]|nr:hypothetical protein [Candidatus Saccharibacteria bacterium]